MIIGLTGQSGAGKTTLCDFFVRKGFVHINCDLLAREVVRKGEKCLDELCNCFGAQILQENGELDRKKLASIAFSDKESLESLNCITHKHIGELLRKRIDEAFSQEPSPLGCIIDAPTLFEAGVDKLCDVTVAVLADVGVRTQRIMQRDNLTAEQAQTRNKAQKEDAFFKERCNYIIYNNNTEDEFLTKINELAQNLGIK